MVFNIKDKLKALDSVVNGISNVFHTLSFWFLLLFLLGFLAGSYCMQKYVDMRMVESVQLKGVIVKGLVYDLKQRP